MPKLVLVRVPFLQGTIANRLWNLAVGVIPQMSTRSMRNTPRRDICDYLVQRPVLGTDTTSVMAAINSRTRAILANRKPIAEEMSNAMGSNWKMGVL